MSSEGAPEPRLTMRVSHDTGRSWSPVRKVYEGEAKAADFFEPSRWPACQCPRCEPRP